ncbi:hypothetical protein VE03_01943 [Pseudogymnoascus sp. 23342-1-I1]|nr:hypothetical protein VE03_01943 [Pseudogymnoascus sp. 23342-1-I1]
MAQMNTTQGPPDQTPTSASPAIDDQIQQMLLKQQNRRRQLEAQEEQNRALKLQDQEELHRKLWLQAQEMASKGAPNTAHMPTPSFHEKMYEVDLKIEEANDRRTQIRVYQEAGIVPGDTGLVGFGSYALEDYQLQLNVLELQNKKRLMMARYEQDTGEAWSGPETVYSGDRPDVE